MRRASIWLIALGIFCIVGAGVWTAWNEMDEQRADEEAHHAVEKLMAATWKQNGTMQFPQKQMDETDNVREEVWDIAPGSPEQEAQHLENNPSGYDDQASEDTVTGNEDESMIEETLTTAAPVSKDDSVAETGMSTIVVDGRTYIGFLSIPELGLDLPVQSQCSETLLKHSPCWYFGSLKEGNLVIAGHNYKRHFTPIKQLKPGAEVTFRDVENRETRYKMLRSEIMDGTDIEGMLAGEDWDLTLFTCTYSGKKRIAIRLVVEN